MRLFILTHRLRLISSIILIAGVLGSGWWVSQQIQAGVIHETAATMGLYVPT